MRPRACALAIAALAAACGRTQQPETPVATPAVTITRSDAAIGTPIEMRYRFVVSPNAPRFTEDEVVFVHFLDTDGELMWTDDHQPPVPTTQWQPAKKNATLAFRNPMRDVLFYLQCDQPAQGLGEPRRVELRIGPMVIDSFALSPGQQELRKIELTKSQLGGGETVEVTVAVDKTFVPAAITQLKSADARELGIRVFRAYVQPR